MKRVMAAVAVAAAAILASAAARAQSSGAAALVDGAAAEASAAPAPCEALSPCEGLSPCAPAYDAPSARVLPAAIIGGSVAAAVSYLFGIGIAAAQPGGSSRLDAIPVVGALAAAGRSSLSDPLSSLLLVSAGAQMMGVLVAVVAGSELAARRRLRIGVVAARAGGGLAVSWRF